MTPRKNALRGVEEKRKRCPSHPELYDYGVEGGKGSAGDVVKGSGLNGDIEF